MILLKYQRKSENMSNIFFGGRLGTYRYYDMDRVIEEAMLLSQKIL